MYQNAYERLSKLYSLWTASISHVIFYYLDPVMSTFKDKKKSGTLKVETVTVRTNCHDCQQFQPQKQNTNFCRLRTIQAFLGKPIMED